MPFEPRGKVALLVDAMRAAPERRIWSAGEVAATMSIATGNVGHYLQAAVGHSLLYRKVENGKSWYSLQPFEPVTPAKLLIPTIKRPGDWVPPVMTPPRGATGYVPRTPLPEPLHQVIAAPAPAVQVEAPAPVVQAPPEVEQEEPQGAEVPEFEAALWHDGDLVLYGVEELEDGGFRIPAKGVECLRWMLGGRAP